MSLSIWLDNPSEKIREDCDIAIIGGGIIGAGAAYWLSQRGGLDICLVEAARLAFGATGRNAGFVLRGIQSYYNKAVKLYGREKAAEIFRFAESSQAHLRDFVARHGDRFDYVPCGSYLLACSIDELADLEESAALMGEDGFAVEYMREDPLDRGFYGAIYNPGDFGVHPAKLVSALIETSGCRVHAGEPVMRIEGDGNERLVVQTAHRLIGCRKVLLATNAFTPLIEPWFAGRIQPVRGQILVTQPLRKRLLDRLCYANYGWEYFRQLPDNRLLLGGCRELHFDDEVGYSTVVTPPVQSSLEHYLKDRFPDAAGVPVDYRWAGTMAFTDDGLPLVGEVKGRPGIFFAVAMNGHGMGYGLAMSKLLASVALDGASAGIFAAERLSQPAGPAPSASKDKGP